MSFPGANDETLKTKTEPKAKILDDGTLMLFGVIGDEWDGLTASQVVSEIRSLGSVDDLAVLINSPGGMVSEGLAIYNELVTNPANVTVEIAGLAASMGSAIAMAGDTVRMAANGMLMIHNPWNVAVGDADDLRKAAEVLDKFGTSLVGIYASKTGLDEDEIRQMMDEETWLDADEALEKGFIDEIVGPVEAEAFADLDVSDLTAVPAALTRLIREGRNMAKTKDSGTNKQAEPGAEPAVEPKAQEPSATEPTPTPDAKDIATEAVRAERRRSSDIRALAQKVGLGAEWAQTQIDAEKSVEEARALAIDALADRQASQDGPGWVPGGAAVTSDERDKFLTGAAAWLILKSGKASLIQKHSGEAPDPGEYRGLTLLELARMSLERGGVRTRGMSKMEVAKAALIREPRGMNTTSDFPILLENVLHKMLLAAYGTVPDTWRMFCAEGSVSDFRPHPRLRLGSFAALDDLLESGEFKQKHFPDAEKESITASTKGNIVGITRQAIVNDDVDGFSRLVTMLGRAAALSVETDVYALLAENSGLGPDLTDGNPLFDAAHSNVGAGAALSAAAIDADRVIMAQQQDPDGNEFLDLRPSTLLVPIGLGSTARQINDAQYDPDSVGDLKPNTVRGLFENVVDTPRLSGTRRYLFADPAVAPTIEVVFLDGMSTPDLETEEGFDYDGVRWRVRHDYGVGATDHRGAVTDAGA